MEKKIVVISLEGQHFWVVETDDTEKEIRENWIKYTSFWTQLHHPLELYDIKIYFDSSDVDKWVEVLARKYGSNKVRGGSYNSQHLSDEQLRVLNQLPLILKPTKKITEEIEIEDEIE